MTRGVVDSPDARARCCSRAPTSRLDPIADANGSLGVVPQDVALYEELTARENLRFWGGLYGLSGKALDPRRPIEVLAAGRSHRRAPTDTVGRSTQAA